MRIVFHAINGVGLGHLVRASTLAIETRALAPDAAILVVTTARDTTILERAGLDFVKLPPRLAEPHADPDRALSSLPESLAEAALTGVLDAFEPDLVVFDTHAPLEVVRRLAERGARSVLVLRELRPAALAAFARSGAHRLFDRIVVPQEPGELDVSGLAGAAVEIVGPVVADRSASAARPRARGAKEIVLAIAGGGGQPVDARRYIRAVADAHCLARARIPDLVTILVTGPYGSAPAHPPAGLEIRRGVQDLGPLFARARLVVSQAGYNAIAEIRARRLPAVLVPGHRKSEDQRERALRLARIGAAAIAKPEARAIADGIERALLTPGNLTTMRAAHDRWPLVPQNRRAALAVIRPAHRPAGPVERVVLVAHDFAPRVGGMETVALALARDLLARRIDVRVYTSDRIGAREASGLPEGVVRPLYTPLPGARRIDLANDLLATIDAARADAPDVVHLCHAGLAAWVPALRVALGCVASVHVHGNDLVAPWVHHAGPADAYARSVVAGLSRADVVLAVSKFSRGLAERAGVPPGKVRVVPNGVDVARFRSGPRDADLAARLGLEPDDEVMLSISRLAARKGHRTAIAALALLAEARPRLKFVFTGENDALARDLLAFARDLRVEDRLVPLGFVADHDLPGLHRLADVFALVPDAVDDDVEGFGVALLEAAASGVPTIGSRAGGVPEAIEEGVTGLVVESSDAPALARAIVRLLEDKEEAKRFSAAGRDRVVRRFADARAAAEVLAAWTSILEASPVAPRRVDSAIRAELETLQAAFGEGAAADALAAEHGAGIARAATLARTRLDAERSRRKEDLARLHARGRVVRLRATSDGACRLAGALDDCASLGVRPRVEIKLRRFLEPDFLRFALPLVESVELVHGLPHPDARRILERLGAASEHLSRVRTLRLFLVAEARGAVRSTAAAVPEVHALRKIFRDRGAVVVPPPELMRYLSETPAGGPDTAMIEPTNLCNLACPTCPTGTGKIKPLPSMTLDRFEHALGELGPQVKNLALWNYGEPLLNRQLPDMIASAKTSGVRVVKVSSNVHFLDGERGRALLRSGLDVLILSVDGASQATYETFRKDGDFERVASSVAWLTAEKKRLGLTKPRVELQFIAMKHNEHELPEMRRLAREWGVDKLRVKTVGADDDDTKHLIPTNRLLSRYDAAASRPNVRHAFCTMAWDHTVINVDGSVTPCCYLRPDMGDAFVMGNVFETSFASIWRGPKYRAFRAQMLDGRESMPVCDRCRGGTHDLLAAVEEVGEG